MRTGCRCHQCKIAWLQRHLPRGVPTEPPIERCKRCNVATAAHTVAAAGCDQPIEAYQDGSPWPVTQGEVDEQGRATRHAEDGAYVLQCECCTHYRPLDMDWGTCLSAASQYHGREVFEHWTCGRFGFADRG